MYVDEVCGETGSPSHPKAGVGESRLPTDNVSGMVLCGS